jgi:hypothetical protein
MKNRRLFNIFAILFLALFFLPAFVFGDIIYFDIDGNVIDRSQHELITMDRDKNLRMKLSNGYDEKANVWKDPIKLRKKRIEQWRIMRSYYDPDSLPVKIENASTKN